MAMRGRVAATVCLAALMGGTAAAQAADAAHDTRVRVMLGGSYAVDSIGFESSRRFTEFAEEGRVEADYSYGGGGGFDGGVGYRVSRHFGVAAFFTYQMRDGEATYRASFPHPLFLDRDREAEGTRDGLSYKESGGHLDLFWTGGSGAIEVSLFGGVSLLSARAELIEPPRYQHAYPYDTLSVTEVPVVEASDSGVGFNAAASVDYRVSRHVGLGVHARFTRASVNFAYPTSMQDTLDLDIGGISAGVGLRIHF